ncbi:MAG: AAA family ATPase [Pyrinomonadaceae bacterium]
MELLYNPDAMLEEEIKATFVARHELIDELLDLIARQPDGAGVQHVVIIAPRGMGKTTVLLMAQFAVRDGDLAAQWQPVKFAEESYGVYDLSDFWIEALIRLSAETDDPELLERAEKLKQQYRDSDDLQEAAFALIKDWSQQHHKRLVLLVDNFDMILEQINDEQDNARLRDVLMNDGTIMLLGAAPTFFREARAYDQPLYNFFKILNLDNLRFAQMQDLLRRRAEIDGIENFEETLKANESRLRVLEYFTGGNPRLVLMLYRVVTQSDISEVRRGLEKLLDEATPYYKAKVESLPAQQRKILDHIARESSRTHEGVTPTAIAESTRLKPNQVSAQLKRLSELGYVRAANLRERNSYYTLSEPLYAIWHQMRFGRDARQRMQWLVNFLKVWYDAAEMGTESTRLEARFREHLTGGRMHDARNALDHRRYLMEAMDDSSDKFGAAESIIRSYLELGDRETLQKELLTPALLSNLSETTLGLLLQADCISQEIFVSSKLSGAVLPEARQKAEFEAAIELSKSAIASKNWDEALLHANRAFEINSESPMALSTRGVALLGLEKWQEAFANLDMVCILRPEVAVNWSYRGMALQQLNRHEEAISSLDRAIEIDAENANSWFFRGATLFYMSRYEEAVASYEQAITLNLDKNQIKISFALACFAAFGIFMINGQFDLARRYWDRFLESKKHFSEEEWEEYIETFTEGFLLIVSESNIKVIRALISESGLEQQLFPLARAIDYLLTGDKSVIEKLSPEVQGVVNEIVAKFESENVADKRAAKSPKRKSAAGVQRRTKKQLR